MHLHFSCVVIIGYVWPEPNSSAAGSRMMQLINFFKTRSKQVIFASPAQLSEHRVDLKALGVIEKTIQLNCESFDQWIKALNPDAVMFDRFMMEEQFGWRVEQQCPDCIRLLDTEDLHSLREARHQQLKTALKNNQIFNCSLTNDQLALDNLYISMANTDICQREIAAIYRCDLTLMISEYEIELLTNKFGVPPALLLHLPFMLEPLTEHIEQKPYSQRQHFVTIGNFRHAPNWDSVLWLKNEIWPIIRQQLPNAQLHIYGAYPAKKVTDLHNPKQGFYIQGWVDDPLQMLSEARICLSPLRFGAGIKGKFTDAMRCSTPSITTDIGAESMNGEYQWPGIVANSCDDIAKSAIELYEHESLWQQAASNCKVIIENRYNAAALTQSLEQTISHLQQNLTSLRNNNFTGTMLRHHHHKSTKYMAQWIEAKNR